MSLAPLPTRGGPGDIFDNGRPLRALGLMSGTSVDGVDVALLESDGQTIARFGPSATYPFDENEKAAIRDAFGRLQPDAVTQLAETVVTEAHIRAVQRFRVSFGLGPDDIDLIGFHGQTITHRPQQGFTWQLGRGAELARATGIATVDGLRQADIAAGGQGAPLVPVFHAALLPELERPLAFLNIGGIANVTWIGRDGELIAFDTGPGNGVLDRWVRQRSSEPFDRDGGISARGCPDEAAIGRFLSQEYFLRKPPKSLDINDITIEIDASLEDGAATLVGCIAASIGTARQHFPYQPRNWIACGGGANNPNILRQISNLINQPVDTARAVGLNGDALEAQAFAFLAVRSVRGLPLTFPGTTGCKTPLTGGVLHQPRSS